MVEDDRKLVANKEASDDAGKLRILHLDDSKMDQILVAATLKKERLVAQLVQVATESEFRSALIAQRFDIILSDLTLLGFDGRRALTIARELAPDSQFIFLSGTPGETEAVESIKAGASDYILKEDLKRLPKVILRARDEAISLREKRPSRVADSMWEQSARQLIDSIEGAFWLTDTERTTFFYVSPGFEKIWGRKSDELYIDPSSFFHSIHEDDRSRVAAAFQREAYCNVDYRIVRPDGQVRWINERTTSVSSYTEKGFRTAGIAIDVTARKELEIQVLRGQRMEMIGVVAGGVAHDLNDSLAPILMATELIKEGLSDPRSKQLLAVIKSSAQRGTEIAKQLITFSRGLDGKRLATPARSVTRELEMILRHTFPKNISIQTSVHLNMGTMLCNPTELQQALLNLCIKARDAMPRGGTLTIAASEQFIDENFAKMCVEASTGPHVVIAIRDTGEGIPLRRQSDSFEDPFETESPAEWRSRLGQYSVKQVVEEHGGFILFENEIGAGSEAKVFLPAKRERDPGEKSLLPNEVSPGRGELILVVDDDETIRTLIEKTLQAFNYRTIQASNGAEAVAFGAVHTNEVRLVLTDLAIPIMDGAAAITALRSFAPGIKAIVLSGSPAVHFNEQGSKPNGLLRKPFTAKELLTIVRRVLDGLATDMNREPS
jgi:two-component system, cell cycle sensor histidine kinase and response regulator CckA